jgi:hypothetical protein
MLLMLAGGCGRIREYHEAAGNLRAVVEVEGVDNVPEPHRTALKVWAEKRDKFWEIPSKVVETFRRAQTLAERLGLISIPVKE